MSSTVKFHLSLTFTGDVAGPENLPTSILLTCRTIKIGGKLGLVDFSGVLVACCFLLS